MATAKHRFLNGGRIGPCGSTGPALLTLRRWRPVRLDRRLQSYANERHMLPIRVALVSEAAAPHPTPCSTPWLPGTGRRTRKSPEPGANSGKVPRKDALTPL